MASNPMQRQARNFFLLGMIVTLVIAAAAVALLFMQMNKINEENKTIKQSIVNNVYVLTEDVKSGDVLTSDMFTTTSAIKGSLPADYQDIGTVLSAYSLYTKNGDKIVSEYSDGQQHLYLNGDKNSEIFKEETTDSYYTQKDGAKTYIETTTAPVVAKISAKANTIISQSMVARSNEIYADDVRKQEYNTIILPIDLVTGDCVDIRLQLPNGQDYIVISKKRIEIPSANGEYLADTIQMNLTEGEILTLSSAIVEAYKIEGAKLYATKYVEAGLQEASNATYVVNNEVINLIASDSNIVDKAKSALISRYNSNRENREKYINSAISRDEGEDGYNQKLDESITSTKDSRQKYLQSLVATP